MGRYKDISGQRFGKLVAVEKTEIKQNSSFIWRCLCDCGNEKFVSVNYLTTGNTKSCGCGQHLGKPRDLTGQKFNMLTAIKRLETSANAGYFWECLCDCGNTTKVTLGNLTTNHTRSCGCLMDAHPLSGSPTHQSWRKMLDRTRGYEEYREHHGDVSVCERWDTRQGGSFDNFVEDMGERPAGTSLNRVNGAKLYSPETCEWATYSLQSFDQKRSKDNKSGRTGVKCREDRQVWEASIAKDYQIIRLYYGPSFEEACKARQAAEIEYYGFSKE